MTTALAEHQSIDAKAIEQVLIKGDLSALSDAQRLAHYKNVCESLGLNPLTTPFDYLKLNNRLVLYAKRDATEQLRKIHGVSITEITTQHFNDVYIVTAKAQDKTGRMDASTGVVPLLNLKGELLANALMKAETKAKRRVTLSICGLGMLDETEVETIPGARTGQTPNYVIEAPGTPAGASTASAAAAPPADVLHNPSVPNGGDSGQFLPEGAVLIAKVLVGEGPQGSFGTIVTHQGEALPVFSEQRMTLCAEFCQNRTPVRLDVRIGKKSGKPYLWEAHTWESDAAIDAEIVKQDAEKPPSEFPF